MGSRQATERQQSELLKALRSLCAERSVVGGALPTVRDLSTTYGTSTRIAHRALKTLQEEGLVRSTRGSGTEIVTRRFVQDEVFVYFGHDAGAGKGRAGEEREFLGFTDRMAELGAFVLRGSGGTEVLDGIHRNGVRCRGMFANAWDPLRQVRRLPAFPFPVVGFQEHADPYRDDSVRWDDRTGGRTATEHLLSLGHRSIAFVGASGHPGLWSRLRAEGYREAMDSAGLHHAVRVLEFGTAPDAHDHAAEYGAESARVLWAVGLPDGIVAANDETAVSFLAELHRLEVPLSRWPAIIGFDDAGEFAQQPISSMRLDRLDVGRAGADLLWGRVHGAIAGPPLIERLPMRLVPRMTSQAGWAYRLHRIFKDFPRPSPPHPTQSPDLDR